MNFSFRRPAGLLATALSSAAMLSGLSLPPGAAAAETNIVRTARMANADDPAGARVIVKFRPGAGVMKSVLNLNAAQGKGPQHAAVFSSRLGIALTDGRAIDERSQVLRAGKSISSAALAARLAADPDVEYAVPDRRKRVLGLPNDPLFTGGAGLSPVAGQWYLRAPDATLVAATNAAAAWNVTTGAAAIVVADLDTGVRFDHPDLVNKLYPGYDFIADIPSANDGNGRDSDASDPGDWSTDSDDCGAENSTWHGTQTAGILGAQSDNGIGMASVGYNTMIVPVRVLGKCGGFDSDIVAGMLWAGGVTNVPTANPHKARVLNMSLGGSGSCSPAYVDAFTRLNAAGVVVVVAAGNEGLSVDEPANCAGAIAVAGIRHAGTKVGYSSLGPQVAVGAPAGNCVNEEGECLYPILTSTNTGPTSPARNTFSDGIDYSVGTSFATPLVTGTAALMLAVNPALTPAQIKSMLKSTARPYPNTSSDPTVTFCHAPSSQAQNIECICTTGTCGAGMLDTAKAVQAASATLSTLDRTLNWAETVYPDLFPRGTGVAGFQAPYTYRYYPSSGFYVGSDGTTAFLYDGVNLIPEGNLNDFFQLAVQAGF